MNDWKDPFDKFIHVKDLLQVFLTLLGYFQDTKTQEVVPKIRQMSVSKLNLCQHMLDLKRLKKQKKKKQKPMGTACIEHLKNTDTFISTQWPKSTILLTHKYIILMKKKILN